MRSQHLHSKLARCQFKWTKWVICNKGNPRYVAPLCSLWYLLISGKSWVMCAKNELGTNLMPFLKYVIHCFSLSFRTSCIIGLLNGQLKNEVHRKVTQWAATSPPSWDTRQIVSDTALFWLKPKLEKWFRHTFTAVFWFKPTTPHPVYSEPWYSGCFAIE